MDTFSALRQRISFNHFNRAHQLATHDIDELVSAAQEAPSAYNLQHTRFLVVTDPAAKTVLHGIAYRQDKVLEAAATFIVLADLEAYRKLPGIVEASIGAGLLQRDKAPATIHRTTTLYSTNPALARDEAIRSASMAAMALMLAATAKGWGSCPMTGFDSKKLQDTFLIAERYLPAMLVAVGSPAMDDTPERKPRLPLDDVLSYNAQPLQEHAFST